MEATAEELPVLRAFILLARALLKVYRGSAGLYRVIGLNRDYIGAI